jgi:ornithine cyclodeaminase/alanine dehydrogenase-like protein (mu-crystallin family)
VRGALIGAGVQGRSHLPVLGHLLPGLEITVHDRHPDRAEALAETARATPGIAAAHVALSARDAVEAADVVVTAASFGPVRQVMTTEWLSPTALVVPVDYATYCAADVARGAALFAVDDRGQFLANRDAGLFDDYPDPAMTLGEVIAAGTPRPEAGRVVVTHLGVGLADVVFGDAILRRAIDQGLGVELPR